MELNDYQEKALSTDVYSQNTPLETVNELGFLNKVLGLAGESGEFSEKVKKIMRNSDGKISQDERKELLKELGDILWYLATISRYLGSDLNNVAQTNLDKLASRQERGVIKSKGDNR